MSILHDNLVALVLMAGIRFRKFITGYISHFEILRPRLTTDSHSKYTKYITHTVTATFAKVFAVQPQLLLGSRLSGQAGQYSYQIGTSQNNL